MQLLSCKNGQLYTSADSTWEQGAREGRSFKTGLAALDQLLPGNAFAKGAVHELLALPRHPFPTFVALTLARSLINKSAQPTVSSIASNTSAIVWFDPMHRLYPPALATLGIPLERLYLLRPPTIADENWAITESLRCRGVAATIAQPRRLSRIEARRFQLAAERGGGAGILLRPYDRYAHIYAATTRWLVSPVPGERTVQKWKLQLIHGHGGRVGESVILELHRDQTHLVRATEQLADRPVQTTTEKDATPRGAAG